MARIDERIVSMAFDSAKFEAGVQKTLGLLGKLNQGLKNIGVENGLLGLAKTAAQFSLGGPTSAVEKFKGILGTLSGGRVFSDLEKDASKVQLDGVGRAADKAQDKLSHLNGAETFSDLEKESGKVSLAGLTRAIDGAASHFSVLQGAAAVALGNIASQAAMKGAAFGKGFAFGPINDGLQEYKTNLGSIQTILANTEGQHVSGLDQVNKHLQELNKYSDQTIYNFSEMAKNIGTFTAAGVDLDTSTASIKGIANLAALSGSNSQQASTAMYQLSQAIAAGKVGLQDWNSVVNAGMGGAKFQKSLIATGVAMGKIPEEAVKIDKATGKATVNGESFRESIMAKPGQESWLSSEVLTSSLKQFTGDMTDAQLKAQGFSDAQVKSIQATAKSAKAAATEVKTLDQVFDVAKETIGSGWSQTFALVFGDFKESKKTFTEMSNTLNGFINQASAARNKLLGEWHKLGGRTVFIEGIKNAFHALLAILGPLHDAFRDIFPATTGKELFALTDRFRDFTKTVQTFLESHADQLERTFKGLFAMMHIGVTIVKAIFGVIGDLFGLAGKNAGGFLDLTANIGDFLVALDKAISSGTLFNDFFKRLPGFLKTPVTLLVALKNLVSGLFDGDGASAGERFSSALDSVQSKLGPLQPVLKTIVGVLQRFRDVVQDLSAYLTPVFTDALDLVKSFGQKLVSAFQNFDLETAFQGLQAGLLGGIFLTLKKALGGKGFDLSFLDNIKKQVTDTLDSFRGSAEAIQKNIKANAILQIAIAVGVLAAGIYALSTIDPKDLTRSMTAVAVGLGQLIGALKLLGGTGGGGIAGSLAGAASLPLLAAGLVILAGALVVLAGAVKLFSLMSWGDLVKGLAGVGGALVAVGTGMRALTASGPRMLAIAPALIGIAIGLNLMATAAKIFATMDWEELAKGLVGLGGALAAISLSIGTVGPAVIAAGPGLIMMAGSMLILSLALASFGNLDLGTIVKGIGALAGTLGVLAIAISAFPPTLIAQAAGLVVLGVALTEIAGALALMGNLKIGTIVKGLIGMGGALAVLAVGLTAMSGTIGGAVALMGAAVAFAILGPALAFMGNLDWGTILKGLAAMALSLGVIAVVGILAAPAILAIGVGLTALGLGLTAIAGAIYLAAKGISLLSDSGQKGVAVLLVALTGFVALLPKIVIDFVKGMVSIVEEIAKVAPKAVVALGVILDTIIAFVLENAYKFAVAVGSLIDAAVKIIIDNVPRIVQAGAAIILGLLKGIDDHIGEITQRVGSIIGKFLGQLSVDAPKLVKGGADVLVNFLKGIVNNLPRVLENAAKVGLTFLSGIVAQLPKFIAAGARAIRAFLDSIANELPGVIRSGVRVVLRFLDGISQQFKPIADKATDVIVRFVNAISSRENVAKLVHAGLGAVLHVLQGIADGLRKDEYLSKIIFAAQDIGFALVEGIAKGLAGLPKRLAEKMLGPLDDAVGFVKKKLGIHSPSRVFAAIGANIVDGLSTGLSAFTAALHRGIAEPLARVLAQTGDAKKIGKFLGTEFINGLTGAVDSRSEGQKRIDDSFVALRGKLKEQTDKVADQLKKDRDRLKTEMDKKHPSEAVIRSIEGDIRRDYKLLDSAKDATKDLTGGLKQEKARMITLADSYSEVTTKLEAAQADLDRLKQQREDAIKSYSDQYSRLPSFDVGLDDLLAEADMTYQERAEKRRKDEKAAAKRAQIDQVANYKKALEQQIKDTEKYMDTLHQLRDLGLDDATYKKLLEEGTAGQEFASQLLSGGKGSIDELNALDAKLAADAAELATNAADAMYQNGINAAQGFVDGLKGQQQAIKDQMDQLAGWMVDAIKKALGIKSPSRVFAEIGKFTMQGMIQGLRGSSQEVTAVAAGIGEDAAAVMRDSLSHISDAVGAEIDIDPTITPVLDLSSVQKDAKQLGDLTNVTPITAAASYGQASSISQETLASQDAQAAADGSAKTIVFEQNNNSPEALSDVEIYRQTKNLLSQAQSALGIPA